MTESWKRAQTNKNKKNPVTDFEWVVQLDNGGFHRVEFAIQDSELHWDCDCKGYKFRSWCAHVAHLWWEWSRGRIVVADLDSGREFEMPPAWLRVE